MAGQLAKGTKIGQYEIVGPVGKGGMASVYRAYQASLDREVAIKIMADQYASDPSFAERFRREARSIARLKHPNILSVYDAGEDNGMLYIVMELIEGQTLKDELAGKPLGIEKVGKIITQIGSALQYANAAGIIHRDVKPSNVLIDKDGRAVLSDFGIAKMAAEGQSQLTGTGMGVGTPDYMSPEQAMGEELDARSDEYSLAVMVYELLTGRPPFTGDTPIAVVMGHVSKPLPSMRQLNPAVPGNVEKTVSKALAKSKEDRYEGTGAFSEALQEAIRNKEAVPPNASVSTTAATQMENFGTQPRPGSGSFQTFNANPEAEQLYQEGRRLEYQNNFHGAFNVFNNLTNRFPNYRDSAEVLQRYRLMGYNSANQSGPNWANQVPSGSTYNPSSTSAYTPGPNNYNTGGMQAQKTKSSLPLILGGIGVLAVIAVLVAVVLAVSGGSKPTPAATATANLANATVKPTVGTTAVALSGLLPLYPGAKEVTVPNDVYKQFNFDASSDAKVQAFVSPDDVKNVKDFYDKQFRDAKWESRADLTSAEALKPFEQVGGYIALYQKDDKGAGVIGLPGALAGALGFTGITQKDTLIIIITGAAKDLDTVASSETTTAAVVTTKAATTSAPTTKAALTPAATTAYAAPSIALYPGSTEVPVSDLFASTLEDSLGDNVNNAVFKSYKTADDGAKVKSYYIDYFKKQGWTDQSALLGSSGAEFETMGGFFLYFEKGGTVAAILAFPGSLSGSLGFTGVGPKDTLIMVITGNS